MVSEIQYSATGTFACYHFAELVEERNTCPNVRLLLERVPAKLA